MRFPHAVEMVERHAARPYGIGVLDGLRDAGLGQHHGFRQVVTPSQVGGDCGGESAPRTVDVQAPYRVSGEGLHT